MGYGYSKRKKDDNHDEILKVFTDAMYYTLETYMMNCGFDFLAWNSRNIFVVEVKDGNKPASQTKLTKEEIEASKKYGDYYRVIYSTNQARIIIQNQ